MAESLIENIFNLSRIFIIGLLIQPVLGIEKVNYGLVTIVPHQIIPFFKDTHIAGHFIVSRPSFERLQTVKPVRYQHYQIVIEDLLGGFHFQPHFIQVWNYDCFIGLVFIDYILIIVFDFTVNFQSWGD